jgi:hypothetical protein
MHHVEVPPLDVQQEGKLRGLWQGARCLPPPERQRDGLVDPHSNKCRDPRRPSQAQNANYAAVLPQLQFPKKRARVAHCSPRPGAELR